MSNRIIGYVYILKNANIPHLVKIGYTDRDPKTRAKELSSFTGVPGKFFVVKSWKLENAEEWEKKIFRALGPSRAEGEFFNLSPSQAIDKITVFLKISNVLDLNGFTQAELEDLKAKEKAEENYFLEFRAKNAIKDWKLINYSERSIADELAEKELSAGLSLELKLKEERIDKIVDYSNKLSVVIIILLCWFYSGLYAFLYIPILFLSWYILGNNQEYRFKKDQLSQEIFYKRRRHYFENQGLPYPFKDKSDIDRLIFGSSF